MVKKYYKGRKIEYLTRDSLIRDGWFVVRSAGSKGIADLVAIRPSKLDPKQPEVALIQCSVGKKPFKQVKPLLDLCEKLNVTPCLAIKGSKIPIVWFWGEEAISKIYKGLKRV
jgi:Holliday junction resolvase